MNRLRDALKLAFPTAAIALIAVCATVLTYALSAPPGHASLWAEQDAPMAAATTFASNNTPTTEPTATPMPNSPPRPALGAPSGLSATTGSTAGSVNLSWTPGANATVHRLAGIKQSDESAGNTGRSYYPVWYDVSGSGRHMVTGLEHGVAYVFAVAAGRPAVDGSGKEWSTWSATATAISGTPPTTTPTPMPTPAPRSTPTPTAALSPVPSGVALRDDGVWHRFIVNANVPVKIIANPTGSTPRLEITTSSRAGNYCPPEQKDTVTRSGGGYVFVAGCVAGTGKIELRQASDNRLLSTYTLNIGNAIPAQTPAATASLSPAPSSVTLRADGQWHRFTVNASEKVKVIANPAGAARRVEIATSRTRNYCPPEQNDIQLRKGRQYVFLAGCVAGKGTVELRRWSDNRLLRTYTFTIGIVTSRPAATPTPTATSRPATPTPTTAPHPTPKPLPALGAVSELRAVAGSGSVTLTWTPGANATMHFVAGIKHSNLSAGRSTAFAVWTNTRSASGRYTARGLESGVEYVFTVVSGRVENGREVWSGWTPKRRATPR